MKTICYVATVPAAVFAFLKPHIDAASGTYAVTVICSPAGAQLLDGLPMRLITISIERKPSPMRDLLATWKIFRIFHREKFDIVHSIMPKAGIVAMLAAFLAGRPLRIHTFTGQVWATRRGIRRWALKIFDRAIAHLASIIIVDGKSQLDYLIGEGVVSSQKARLLGAGSICGVDIQRFKPDHSMRELIRSELDIDTSALLILFVGRLTRDKGIWDLVDAFDRLASRHLRSQLIFVGTEEDICFSQIRQKYSNIAHRMHFIPFSKNPENYMVAADIYCLPSYREGFPLTVIEAAACAIPAVASRIYGIQDTIIDGVTGVLVPPGDIKSLELELDALLSSKDKRNTMGKAARSRVIQLFAHHRLTHALLELYSQLADELGLQGRKSTH